jgi:hypothetical protein
MTDQNRGSLGWGTFWMVLLPVLLCWLPGVGGLIGGIVGGKVAGGVGRALLAWLISTMLVGALFTMLGTMLTGFVIFGVIAGLGAFMITLIDSGMRLLGAIIGGAIA